MDRVNFIGDPVAVIFAETLEAAKAAADTIQVEYKPLPGVFDMGIDLPRDPRRRQPCQTRPPGTRQSRMKSGKTAPCAGRGFQHANHRLGLSGARSRLGLPRKRWRRGNRNGFTGCFL